MKLVFISDIHSNFEALRSIKDELLEADRIVCLGDVLGYYCQVNEVIDFLRNAGALCVLGNHDHYLLAGYPQDANPAVRFGMDVADKIITSVNRAWLGTLPLVWGGRLGGISLLLAHGSPWDPLTHYLYNDNTMLESLSSFKFDVVAFGQTHRLYLNTDRRPHRLNPGSVGQPRDLPDQSSYITLDTETMIYHEKRCAFDPAPVIKLAMEYGAGNWITKHLQKTTPDIHTASPGCSVKPGSSGKPD